MECDISSFLFNGDMVDDIDWKQQYGYVLFGQDLNRMVTSMN
jgi:hypothetical protein